MSHNRSTCVKMQGVSNHTVEEIPTDPSSCPKNIQHTSLMHALFSFSLSDFSISAVTSHSAVFRCHFSYDSIKSASGWVGAKGHVGRGNGTQVKECIVAKGVIIPQGVTYCCPCLSDKTKLTGQVPLQFVQAFILVLDNLSRASQESY